MDVQKRYCEQMRNRLITSLSELEKTTRKAEKNQIQSMLDCNPDHTSKQQTLNTSSGAYLNLAYQYHSAPKDIAASNITAQLTP
jgi:hypothetical protein